MVGNVEAAQSEDVFVISPFAFHQADIEAFLFEKSLLDRAEDRRFTGQTNVPDTDLVRTEVEAVCATTVGNWGVSASNLKEIRFPLPPLAEQRRIVAKVDALMAVCDQLEASLTAASATRRRLLDALLAEALAPVDARELEAAE